ncbi:MAG: RusA family crossover junction endodeoxyribonuclease [Clostridiaceae bacterium]
MKLYAKIIIKGSPITKSNFKLSNIRGRAILPYNSGKYHDRYALYEEEIAYHARSQNPGIALSESLIAVLKVFYKSKKRHPDTTNITKSIFDGIEKSGLIVNDAQIRRLIIEEFYDSENPRFELELFGESIYSLSYKIEENDQLNEPIYYSPPSNRKNIGKIPDNKPSKITGDSRCEICGKDVSAKNSITADKGSKIICRECLKNLF